MEPVNSDNYVTYHFERFELDPVRRVLQRDGESIMLKPKAFETLLVLIRNSGRVMEKDDLMQQVWPDTIVEEVNLAHHISVLRKALGQKSEESRFIVTVPGRGYGFVADVKTNRRSPQASATTEYEVTRSRVIIKEESEERDENNLIAAPPVIQTELRRADPLTRLDGHSPNGLLSHRATRFLLGGSIVLIAAVGGILGWRLYSQQKSRDDAALLAFSEAKIKQLTTKGTVRWVALSRQGTFYAYTFNERGERKESLWLAQTDGSKELQLQPPAEVRYHGLAFSPDGKTLFFTQTDEVRSQNGLFRIPVLGGIAEKLPLDIEGQFTVAPDGKQIAFVGRNGNDDSSTLFVGNLDGSGVRELVSRPAEMAFSQSVDWSPDGSMLAVPAVSNAARESREVFVIRLSDGQCKQLTNLDWLRVSNVVWLPDARGLIIVAADNSETVRQLWRVDYPKGTAHRFSRDTDGYGTALSISADGNLLSAVQAKRESNIWIASADNLSASKQVTFSSFNGLYGAYGFDWTPNNRIVFTAGVDRSVVIYSMDLTGGEIKQLTSAGFFDQRPKATADGRFIVFQSNRSGSSEIWRVNLDGTDLRQLTSGGRNSAPDTTPDSKWVVYASIREGRSLVFRIPIDGGEPLRVTNDEANYPQVSSDAKLIACSYRAGSNSRAQLALVRLEDGGLEKVFDVPRSMTFSDGFRWTPDGQALCYMDSNIVWRQEINGRPPQRLEGVPEELSYHYAWSRDGKIFAFARGRSMSDAVLISTLK